MKIRKTLTLVLFALFFSVSVFAVTKSKEELAEMAVSSDGAVSAEAVKNLRGLGKDGLDALFRRYASEIAKFSASGESSDDWKRIAAAIDTVAQQKDAYSSGLYWYTDFDAAKREAARQNKPILSLRLLGSLNEEFSCANSRFFRALLYSNAEVSKYLRENYVLHWKSVRPVPRITIDFGDGRKIERTVTGNSIHYILDENGGIIDALPGLYSPSGFLKYLKTAYDANKAIDNAPAEQKAARALFYRKTMFDEIKTKRDRTVAAAKVTLTAPKDSTVALDVMPRAVTKMSTEATLLVKLDDAKFFNPRIADNFALYEAGINLEDWRKLSKLYAGQTKFDDATVAFIKRQNAKTGLTGAEMTSLLSNVTGLVMLDTTRNDFLFHTKLYEWLNQTGVKPDLDTFNSRVYAELFKTPESDKWLGLYNTDVYTALDGNGITR